MASTDEEDRMDDTDDNASSENHRPSLNHRRSMSVDASGIRSQNVFVSGIIVASRRDDKHFLCSHEPFLHPVVLIFTLFLVTTLL